MEDQLPVLVLFQIFQGQAFFATKKVKEGLLLQLHKVKWTEKQN